jgi:hypothetical protein
MALTHVEAAILSIYTLRNLEQRRILTDTQITLMQNDLARMGTEVREQFEDPFLLRIQIWNELLASIGVAKREQFINYLALLEKSLNFNPPLLGHALDMAGSGISGDDTYSSELKRCHDTLVEHLALARQGRFSGITLESLVR